MRYFTLLRLAGRVDRIPLPTICSGLRNQTARPHPPISLSATDRRGSPLSPPCLITSTAFWRCEKSQILPVKVSSYAENQGRGLSCPIALSLLSLSQPALRTRPGPLSSLVYLLPYNFLLSLPKQAEFHLLHLPAQLFY
jgi:hypothetical protein